MMQMEAGAAGPRMSVVLVTDRYATIRGVVRALAAQTVAGALEVVLVGPAPAPLEVDARDLAPLHGHRVVTAERIIPLAGARATGVRAATAPVITVGETHAFPDEHWAERVLASIEAGAAAVVPGFTNGNPDGALSWSNLINDYGRWSDRLEPGETTGAPAYHLVMRRSVTDALGDRIDDFYSWGYDATGALHSAGHAIRHEPGARMYHVNVSRPLRWVGERVLLGRVQAAWRSRDWGPGRRALYALGSPLIPAVVLSRGRSGVRRALADPAVPRRTGPAVLAGVVLKSLGEAVGFVAGSTEAHRERAEEYEIHKVSRNTRRGVDGLEPRFRDLR